VNKKIQEHEEKEREKAAKSERFQALRGRVQFAKAIWKDVLRMDLDVLTY